LRFIERVTLAKVSSANQRELGNLLLAQAEAWRARVAYKQALTTYPSLRSLIKYLVSLLPARFALILVRWGRWCDRHCIRLPGDFESFRYVRTPNTTSSS
jgi:hypothetical protein